AGAAALLGRRRGRHALLGAERAARRLSICVPIATHAPHAVGVACAVQLRREPPVPVCARRDGGTAKGGLYEALNAAGVRGVPRGVRARAGALAQRASAGGVEGEEVDGNAVIAVHAAVARAREKARNGGGPHVIEALTYRMSDHTTADDARRYRSEDEVERRR